MRLLRPLVRYLIQSGVTFPVLADMLRSLYVDVALRDLRPEAAAQTDSRICLLTGVHRKEVRRQRAFVAGQMAEPAIVTRTSAILAHWLGSPAYTDAGGRPLPLARAGDGASFQALVASVTRDVRPRAVLEEWLNQELVTLDPDGRVRLSVAAFIPREDRDAQLFYFTRNLHDHIAAAVGNLGAPAITAGRGAGSAPFIDRSVHYDGLTVETARRLESAAREVAQQLLVDINRAAIALVDAQEAQSERADGKDVPTRRVNLGVYLFADDEPPRMTDT